MGALARARSLARNGRSARRGPPPATTMSAAGPDARDPQPLGASLESWVRDNDYGAELAVAGLVGRWREIVGEQMAQHVQVGEYDVTERRVVLAADSQEWAMQVRYLLSQVQRRIDEELGKGLITQIQVRGPGGRTSGPGSGRGTWRVRTGRRSPRSQ
jgi:predicted nucleic acid-binding Zn ribbon protein